MSRQNRAPNGERIAAHNKFTAVQAMGEHIKATEGNIERCIERTNNIWKRAEQALNEKVEEGGSYYSKLGFFSLDEQAANVLHYKGGNMVKAKALFKLWWKTALKEYTTQKKSAEWFKREHPEAWTASQKIQIDGLLRAAARYEQMAKDAYAEARELGAEIPTDASPERVKELKTIMQRNHPDRGGDADLFQAAKRKLEDIRKGINA